MHSHKDKITCNIGCSLWVSVCVYGGGGGGYCVACVGVVVAVCSLNNNKHLYSLHKRHIKHKA